MDYTVRLGTTDDADTFCPLLASLGYPTDPIALKERISRILQTPDAVLLVAAHQTTDAVGGLLSIQFIPQLGLAGDVCHICFFVVAENLHRAGIGKLLESTAEELSRKRGCDRMVSLVPEFPLIVEEVHCHERRVGAHRFYEKQGYSDSPKFFFKRFNEDTEDEKEWKRR